MVNKQELLDFIPVLYMLEQENRFKMSAWADGIVNPQAASIHECKTQFCAAGAKARIDGWLPQYRMQEVWSQKRGEYIEAPIATGNFTRSPDQQDADHATFGRDALSIASEAFGLDHGEADFLFMATHITRASDMERRIRWLVDGNQWYEFPKKWEDEEEAHAEADDERVVAMDEFVV